VGFLKRLFGGPPEKSLSGPTEPTLFGGNDSLEVVGESHYQQALRELVGSTADRVRIAVDAMLMPETDNKYDSNAVSVWISGRIVGYLSREAAAELRPGLLDLQRKRGTAVALPGVIAGGGNGRSSYGVFLNYDRAAFGLTASEPPSDRPIRVGAQVLIRTGLSGAIAEDDDNDGYDLSWRERMPTDRLKAMTFLRQELAAETEPVSRHFLFAHLEGLLYGAREDLASALAEYDTTCESHHAEMSSIRPSLIAMFGGLPLMETYKQAAIRHQRVHDWASALQWADDGIAIYGNDALRPEFRDDLAQRAARYRQQLESQSSQPRRSLPNPMTPGEVVTKGEPMLETLVCESCGQAFVRARTRGRKPHECPTCRGVAAGAEL
jgi:hypothetical protein